MLKFPPEWKESLKIAFDREINAINKLRRETNELKKKGQQLYLTRALNRELEETFNSREAHQKVVDKHDARIRTLVRRLNKVTGEVVKMGRIEL